ncbi:MAG TPA: polysaccharide deacetylase family protein [Rhodopila sp.]|nr:polysaccharide deacetylase family protein [Rhodopila sp.]
MKADFAGARSLITTSWDDGHPSDLRVAELLEKHGISGTFYVPTRNAEGRKVMQPAEVRQVARRFEIGGHTRDHVSLTDMSLLEAEDQIVSNKSWLEDLLGQEVSGFAYVRGHHNRMVRQLVRRLGFRYARTVRNLSASPGMDRFQMPTTMQFFAHPNAIYLRNCLSGGPSLERVTVLRAVLGGGDLVTRLTRAAETCLGIAGHFHLWGHSWELEEHQLWDDLDRFLGWLEHLPAGSVPNAGWCIDRAGVATRAGRALP